MRTYSLIVPARVGLPHQTGVDDPRRDDAGRPPAGEDYNAADRVAVEDHRTHPGVQQWADPAVDDPPVPRDLQRLRLVSNAGSRAVGVAAQDGVAGLQHRAGDLPPDAADDALLAPRGEEAVHGVEHGRGRAAEEPPALDQDRAGAVPGGHDGRSAPGRAAADHGDIGLPDHGDVRGLGGAESDEVPRGLRRVDDEI
ncbi:MAG TPA: hypothetical protein PKY27_02050 [Arachnia sp.]|nr:hypothetical protein [Arachnia sp.]HQD21015.1 hypothetical protein [Arachnia sp.]